MFCTTIIHTKTAAAATMLLALPLCGCVVPELSNVHADVQADVPAHCTIPTYTFAPSPSALAALQKAFQIARTGAIPGEPELGSISVSDLVGQDVEQKPVMLTTGDTLSTLQSKAPAAAAVPAVAAAPTTVQEELSRRIPWLSGYPRALANSNSSETAKASLKLVSLVGGKHAALVAPASDAAASQPAAMEPEVAPAAAASGAVTDNAPATIHTGTRFSMSDHTDLEQAWQKLSGLEPFHVLTLLAAHRIIADLDHPTPSPLTDQAAFAKLVAEVRLFNIADFLATYFDAYFRNGEFFSITVTQTAFVNGAIDELKTAAGGTLPDEAALRAALTKACSSNAKACLSLGSVSSTGFVSLFGDTTQFGAVQVNFNGQPNRPVWKPSVSRPEVSQFGPDMVRVLVEAIADANGPHPAGAPTATACQTVNNAKLFIDDDTPGKPSQCFAQASAETADWQRTSIVGNAAESVITAGVGAAIRSIGPAALNNETIASVLETLAGVTARKAVQTTMARCESAPAAAGKQIQPVQIGVVESGAGK
jgi:hypothetical protein